MTTFGKIPSIFMTERAYPRISASRYDEISSGPNQPAFSQKRFLENSRNEGTLFYAQILGILPPNAKHHKHAVAVEG